MRMRNRDRSVPTPTPRRPVRRYRPEVSGLEGRELLSTFTVQNLNDSGTGSLPTAIAQAEAAGGANVINFARGLSGTIKLSSPLTIAGNLTINGPGASTIALNGQDATQDIVVDPGATASISGLTITGGLGWYGGGLENDGNLRLAGMAFQGNEAKGGGLLYGYGGGIYNASGATLAISSSSFTRNLAVDNDSGGGGIYNVGTLTMLTSAFSGNTATFPDLANDPMGDGIYNGTTATIVSCTFTADAFNSILSTGNLTLRQSTISGDKTVGVDCSGVATIDSCTVSGNGASGADTVYDDSGIKARGIVKIVNSTVADNQGAGVNVSRGAILPVIPSDVTIASCTIAGNTATSMAGDVTSGAGINVVGLGNLTQISLHDTILAGNLLEPSGGKAILNDLYTSTQKSPLMKPPQYISLGYNLIQAPGSAVFTGTTAGNLYGVNPDFGPLANNGGPTETMALLAGSPAIDAGDPNLTGLPATDQRGLPRTTHGHLDIGAYEVQ